MSIHPALALLAAFALPTVLASTWRPGVERAAEEQGAPSNRLARHLFVTATTAPPGKEVRVTGIGDRLVAGRRGLGSVVRAGGRGALGKCPLAHAGVGVLRSRVRRRRVVHDAGYPCDAGQCPARAGGGFPAVGIHRCHRGRDRFPARHLARRLEAPCLARGLRGRTDRALRRAGTAATRYRNPLRARLLRLSRHGATRARGCLPRSPGRLRGGHRR